MTVAYEGHGVTVHIADALDVLAGIADASVDAVVTDPPYGLEFMGKEWDGADGFRRSLNPNDAGRDNAFGRSSRTSPEYRAGTLFQEWAEAWSRECLRVLKPGGHLLAFGGTRTWHRLACAVEDAGFEVRDSIAWLYGSGFPKSLDVSKAIDKAAGAEREIVGSKRTRLPGGTTFAQDEWSQQARAMGSVNITAPATDAAREWQGWGTALKPAFEPIVVGRKPLAGTVAANVLTYGTGALNVDACRVGTGGQLSWSQPRGIGYMGGGSDAGAVAATENPAGRWPANVALDDTTAAHLDEQSGLSQSRCGTPRGAGHGDGWGMTATGAEYGDEGGASRFFPTFRRRSAPTSDLPRWRYEAKAPTTERPRIDDTAHPTVKPLDLMRWLVRLVTPPGGLVLDPFAGSGTTAEACILEGFRCVTIDKEPEHLPLILQRINRQRDPVEAIRQRGEDLGLFDHLEGAP